MAKMALCVLSSASAYISLFFIEGLAQIVRIRMWVVACNSRYNYGREQPEIKSGLRHLIKGFGGTAS
jgi:hypothetical protein